MTVPTLSLLISRLIRYKAAYGAMLTASWPVQVATEEALVVSIRGGATKGDMLLKGTKNRGVGSHTDDGIRSSL